MDTKSQVIEIIKDLNEDFDPSEEVNIIEDGILDSFDIVNFILEVDEVFGITIGVEDIVPENFASIDTITQLIERIKNNPS